MKAKKIIALGLAAMMTLSLVACGSSSDKKANKGDDSIIVYTNSGSDGRDVWLEEKAKEAGLILK